MLWPGQLGIAGTAAGGTSTSFNYAMEDVINKYKISIFQSTRVMSEEVPTSNVSSSTALQSMFSIHACRKRRLSELADFTNPVASGHLNPMKSHILLGILLAHGTNMTEIAQAFVGSTDD